MSGQVTDEDLAAIERTVTDYFDSWFEGDPDKMARVLHPKLSKRRGAGTGTDLIEVPADDLVDDVASGPKGGWDRQYQVDILAMDDGMASVAVHSDPFTEYLHLGRFDGAWLIVNAFYRRNRQL